MEQVVLLSPKLATKKRAQAEAQEEKSKVIEFFRFYPPPLASRWEVVVAEIAKGAEEPLIVKPVILVSEDGIRLDPHHRRKG